MSNIYFRFYFVSLFILIFQVAQEQGLRLNVSGGQQCRNTICRRIPSDIDFSRKPMTGPMAYNQALVNSQRLFFDQLQAPETVLVHNHALYATSKSDGGALYKLNEDTQTIEVVARTGGAPLGFVPFKDGFLVADAIKGLLQINPGDNSVKVLANSYTTPDQNAPIPITFADGVDIDAVTGKVYVTSACACAPQTPKDVLQESVSCLIKLCGRSVVLEYDMNTQKTTLLKSGLQFGNGVAVVQAPNHHKVLLVVDTYGLKVWRYYLAGPQTGQWDTFMTTQGMGDNIVFDKSTNTLWLAYFNRQDQFAQINFVMSVPFLRNSLLRFPRLRRTTKPVAMVAQIDLNGNVMRSFHDTEGQTVGTLSHAFPYKGFLYMGSVANNYIAKAKI